MKWDVLILEGYYSDLAKALNTVAAAGGMVRFVLPNGVNRWTVIWTIGE